MEVKASTTGSIPAASESLTVVGIPGEAGEQIHIGHGEKRFQLLGQLGW